MPILPWLEGSYLCWLKRMTQMDYGPFYGMIAGQPRAVPSDADGVLEHCGHFIFFEWKRPGEGSQTGQKRWLAAAKNLDPKKVTIIIAEHTGIRARSGAWIAIPQRMKVDNGEWQDIDLAGMRAWIQEWWTRVETA